MADAKTIPTIKQGDAYSVPIELYLNGVKLTAEQLPMLEEIEVTIGEIEPIRMAASEAWSEAAGAFLVPLTQVMTFALEEGRTDFDVRVQFKDGDVIGLKKKLKIKVVDATSEEVL